MMADGVLLVPEQHRAVHSTVLAMECDAQEIPSPRGGSKPIGWWLAERSSYQGAADEADTQLKGLQPTTCEGTAALAVTAERVFGIVSPNDETTPAVWWSWSLSALDVETAGSQGFLKKRPVAITLTLEGGTIELSAVSRLYRNSGRYQTGQEGSLLKALER